MGGVQTVPTVIVFFVCLFVCCPKLSKPEIAQNASVSPGLHFCNSAPVLWQADKLTNCIRINQKPGQVTWVKEQGRCWLAPSHRYP